MKSLKYLFLLSSLLFIASIANTQNVLVKGVVLDSLSVPIEAATIQFDEKHGTITNNKGEFQVSIPLDMETGKLSVRHIAYGSLDTILTKAELSELIIIRLKNTAYLQPKIEIVGDGFNIFEDNKWTIFDFVIYEGKILISYSQKRKNYLGLFSKAGYKIDVIELSSKYEDIFISCGNKIHLIRDDKCLEINFVNDRLFPISVYSNQKFKDLIEPCSFKSNDTHVYKEYSKHNKSATYFSPTIDGDKHIICNLEDEVAAGVSQSYYNELIGMYYKTCETPDSTAINYLVKGENKIVDGNWSGDVTDLIINNDMHKLVGYYVDVESKPLKVFEFKNQGRLHLIDVANQKLFVIDHKNLKPKKFDLKEGIIKLEDKLLFDQANNLIWVIKNKNELVSFTIPNLLKGEQSSQLNIKPEGMFPKALAIHNQTLHYFSRKSKTNFYSQFYKLGLD